MSHVNSILPFLFWAWRNKDGIISLLSVVCVYAMCDEDDVEKSNTFASRVRINK